MPGASRIALGRAAISAIGRQHEVVGGGAAAKGGAQLLLDEAGCGLASLASAREE